jgi:hypothetical protein
MGKRYLLSLIFYFEKADLREICARLDNGQSVICVNQRNLRTSEKAGTKGPQITLIVD